MLLYPWVLLVSLCLANHSDEYLPGYYQQAFTVSASLYSFNLYLGTPPQMLTVYLDFGSADLFISSGANDCAKEECSIYGNYPYFNTNDSDSFSFSGSFFTSSLSSDSLIVTAEWATDIINFMNVTLDNFTLAYHDNVVAETIQGSYGTSSYISWTSAMCYLGIGPKGLEESVQWVYDGHPGPTYPNFLYSLPGVEPVYSIWVNPGTNTDGVVTFGAIDTAQFIPGTLVTVPIVNQQNIWSEVIEPVYLGVSVNSLTVNLMQPENLTNWINQTLVITSDVAVFDSKANFSLPQAYLEQLGTALSAVWSGSKGMYLMRCDLEGEIVIAISGFEFQIPLQEQLIPLGFSDTRGIGVCGLNIGVSRNVIFSNKLLQKYYVVVDYIANEIAFGSAAKVGEVTSSTKIVTFSGSIPYATPAILYNATQIVSGLEATVGVSYIPTGLVLPATVSSAYVLGGTPVPTIETKLNAAVSTRSMAKVTEASNAAGTTHAPRGQSFLYALVTLLFSLL